MTVIEPKAEFRSMDEASVMAALEDNNPDNRVAVELARLIAGYTMNFQQYVERLGARIPWKSRAAGRPFGRKSLEKLPLRERAGAAASLINVVQRCSLGWAAPFLSY